MEFSVLWAVFPLLDQLLEDSSIRPGFTAVSIVIAAVAALSGILLRKGERGDLRRASTSRHGDLDERDLRLSVHGTADILYWHDHRASHPEDNGRQKRNASK
jgi:hypothetical protein